MPRPIQGRNLLTVFHLSCLIEKSVVLNQWDLKQHFFLYFMMQVKAVFRLYEAVYTRWAISRISCFESSQPRHGSVID